MENYLRTITKKLKEKKYKNLNIILGNESCDLDSAVSSIAYAIFLHWQHKQIEYTVCTRHSENTDQEIFVPMLNIKRVDYLLKTEVVYCLTRHGVMEQLLTFRDDIDIKEISTTKQVNIILVDHHVLSKENESLVPFVTEIIDHRPKDEKNWRFENVRSTIEIVGSCGTLVTQRIRDQSELLRKHKDFFVAYNECAELLHSVILLDTVNFSKSINKTTPHDVESVTFLESILRPGDVEIERKLKVDALVRARCDVSSLTPYQMLQKDLKTVADVMVPTLPMLVREFLDISNALQAANEALSQRSYNLIIIMGLDTKSGGRDLAIVSTAAPERGVELAKLLQNWNSPSFMLESEEKEGCIYFKINNLSISRKTVIPIINEFVLNYNK